MGSNECSGYYHYVCIDEYEIQIQKNLDKPMPWIGMYIATASALCTLAMAADALRGFKSKKLWFPCKFFSLNATSLTLLTVTTKLTVDITSSMMGSKEKIASISSLVMMSTSIGNFMISIASMENNEILLNLTALCILGITVAVNVSIHNGQIVGFLDGRTVFHESTIAIFFMLFLLIILCSSAIVVPTTKRYVELKYGEMHKIISNEKVAGGKFTIHELRVVLKKYYVMAETGSPQFVMARSVTSANVGMKCLLMELLLVSAYIRMPLYNSPHTTSSNYKWSINWISFIQSGGVALGTIAPLLRWFFVARFRSTKIGHRSLKEELKIETYWIQRLVEWRESSLPLRIRHQSCRKFLHDAKRLFLSVCIRIQIIIILASKLVLLLSVTCTSTTFSFFSHIKKLMDYLFCFSNDTRELEPRAGTELDFSRYVLLLEGEPELPKNTLANICSEVDNLIQIGKRQQQKNIIRLLQKSENFNGVREFDNNEVKSLHSQEPPPNCWSLSVVTLSSIAVALPNISDHNVDQLLTAVSEGLSLVKLIEETTDTNGELLSIRNAADVVWVGLELYHKWQNKDIQVPNLKDRTYKHILQELSNIAEKTFLDFKIDTKDLLMENPLNWPVKVIAANSMYRICQTLLLAHKDGNNQIAEEMFEQLSIIISGILAACLTNLAHIISIKCHSISLKERVESVSHAAVLLGESEEILQILEQRELPNLDPGKAVYIDEWRAVMDHDVENPLISGSVSSNETTIWESNGCIY